MLQVTAFLGSQLSVKGGRVLGVLHLVAAPAALVDAAVLRKGCLGFRPAARPWDSLTGVTCWAFA